MNIVITGANSGIGVAIASVFAAHAQEMFLTARNEDRLLSVKQQLLHHAPHLRIHTASADLLQRENWQTLAQRILHSLNHKIDILVNNVGMFLPSSFPDSDTALFDNTMQLNISSIYHITQALCPAMIQRQTGHIFNICSTASLKAYPHGMAYGTSKYALKGFSDNLREALKPHKIKVTAIMPGPTWTKSWEGTNIDQNQLMQAQDVAKMVFSATQLSSQAVVEEIKMRPLNGDVL